MKAAERWSEHTQHLYPLKVGDTVRIQNQRGPFPTKWDKTGCVVEVRQFDQYVVRVDGSGRVMLRNRKFLRKYMPIQPCVQPRSILTDFPVNLQPSETSENTMDNEQSYTNNRSRHASNPKPISPPTTNGDLDTTENIPVNDILETDTPVTHSVPKRPARMLTGLQTFNKPGLLEQPTIPPIQSEDVEPSPRRSQRLKDERES